MNKIVTYDQRYSTIDIGDTPGVMALLSQRYEEASSVGWGDLFGVDGALFSGVSMPLCRWVTFALMRRQQKAHRLS
jgi:hypothetical protein